MFKQLLLPGTLAVAALASSASTSHAWIITTLPFKVDTDIHFRVNVLYGPELTAKPEAPWYMYFPANPQMTAPQGGSLYPTWPTYFPQAQPQPVPQVQQTSAPGIPAYWFGQNK